MRSDDLTRTMMTHVAYEVAALELTSQLVEETGDRFYFEAFLVHARALGHFFWPTRIQPKDVVADNFVVDVQRWRTSREPKSVAVNETWKPINRQLAHLSWDRASRSAFLNLEPYVQSLTEDLMRQWRIFLEHVPTQRGTQFRSDLEARRKEVRTRVAAQ